MKIRICVFAFMVMSLLGLTACSTNDMEAYFKAIEMTEQETSGLNEIEFYGELTFNELGLNQEALKTLNYFDVIHVQHKERYQKEGETVYSVSALYYNLGGLGLDMSLYQEGDQLYMKMPVQDKYLDFSDQMAKANEGEMTEEQEIYVEAVSPLIEEWKKTLKLDDIVRGERTYVITEQGQIKATTYEITIDEDQLQSLSNTLMDQITEDDFMDQLFTFNGEDLTQAEIVEIKQEFKETMKTISIDSFKGTAFVDYDGRMIRQNFEFTLSFDRKEAGSIQTLSGHMTIESSELGQAQILEFPEVTEDMWIDEDESDDVFRDMFPTDIN